MASLSPPGSPDVNDAAVFKDLPASRHRPGEGISLADLMSVEERFGAPEMELQEEESRLPVLAGPADPNTATAGTAENPVEVDVAGGVLAGQRGRQPAPAVPEWSAEWTPTIEDVLYAASPVEGPHNIPLHLREIAAASPPFEFPTGVHFTIILPALADYKASFNGLNALDRGYWTFTDAHACGREDITALLTAVQSAGQRFGARRCGVGDQSPQAYLCELRILVDAFFKLNEIDFFSRIEHPSQVQIWISDKTRFVVDHMRGVIDGENAYYGARPIGEYLYNSLEVLRVRDRFNALLERVVHWSKYIAQNLHVSHCLLKGTLIDRPDATEVEMRRWRLAIDRPLQQGGTPEWLNFFDGHTKYRAASLITEIEPTNLDKDILALLPNIEVHHKLTAAEDMMPVAVTRLLRQRIDLPASNKVNKEVGIFTRGLIQQYIALRALLASCNEAPDAASPWATLPNDVQLDKSHGNRRSIMIFKAAWLVVAQAEKLWLLVLKHESKGHINPLWTITRKAELQTELELMTEIAVLTQVDGAREALRYRAIGRRGKVVRYW